MSLQKQPKNQLYTIGDTMVYQGIEVKVKGYRINNSGIQYNGKTPGEIVLVDLPNGQWTEVCEDELKFIDVKLDS